jgi:hypothetical protein
MFWLGLLIGAAGVGIVGLVAYVRFATTVRW